MKTASQTIGVLLILGAVAVLATVLFLGSDLRSAEDAITADDAEIATSSTSTDSPATPPAGESPENVQSVSVACEQAGGSWLPDHSECEYVSREWCADREGRFRECTSACRHNPEADLCTMQCVPVCQL